MPTDNIIRETLRQYSSLAASNMGQHSRPPSSHSSSPYLSPYHLHQVANRKCLSLLPATLSMIRYHLSLERTIPAGGLFTWDAGLVRDGCYYAGFLSASIEGDTIEFPTDEPDGPTRSRAHMSCEDAITLCISAITQMRWAFSKSEEREESLRSLWEERKLGRGPFRGGQDPSSTYARSLSDSITATHISSSPTDHFNTPNYDYHPERHHYHNNSNFGRRASLPPINIVNSPTRRHVESAPNTGYTTNGHGMNGWPSYTPPGTGTSAGTSGTGVSNRSPFHGMVQPPQALKQDLSEPFYPVSQDLDQFSYHPPPIGPGIVDPTMEAAHYSHRDPPGSSHSLHGIASGSAYIDPGM
jgi:hypothetical protein